jgi:hypothetical protein
LADILRLGRKVRIVAVEPVHSGSRGSTPR